MAKIAGVTQKKNAKGEVTAVLIDLKKHGPALKKIGLIEKTQFEIDFENAQPIDEAFDEILQSVTNLWKK